MHKKRVQEKKLSNNIKKHKTNRVFLYNKVSATKVLGPGNRYALWFQGCKQRCENCIATNSYDISQGIPHNIDKLLKEILHMPNINGITISGGEPFLQPQALLQIVSSVKKYSSLDVMLYSGYTYKTLKTSFPLAKEILDLTDIFIDGPYLPQKDFGYMWRGSQNQNIYFFSDKYKNLKEKVLQNKSRSFEAQIQGETIMFIGIPTKENATIWNQIEKELLAL